MKHARFLVAGLPFLLSFCQSPAPATPGRSLQQIASEINKGCPQVIDAETKIDRIDIKNGNTIVYNYTLINLLAQNVDTATFKRELWPGILSIIRTSPEIKELREQHTNFEYVYRDKQQALIYTFKIYPKDYNS